jgi:hypothetical protein
MNFKVSNESFLEALLVSLNISHLFVDVTTDSNADYILEVILRKLQHLAPAPFLWRAARNAPAGIMG